VVTALWTLATVLRLERVRVPARDWQVLLGDLTTWLSLLVPPFAFALMLAGIAWVADAYRRTRE
jgi:hypothetical protein